MSELTCRLVCSGCAAELDPTKPYPFRCPNAASQPTIDHVVVRHLDPIPTAESSDDNPYLRYRERFCSYQVARAAGLSDAAYVRLVRRLDAAVAEVDGVGFRTTPFAPSPALRDACGLDASSSLWIKNETGNVSGSHKARHLMGVLIYLEVLAETGAVATESAPSLAIASCGNAALAAAVLARAGERSLDVFIPTDADPNIVARLRALGARLNVCAREPGEAPKSPKSPKSGDPCYLRFVEETARGALPFSCQGSDNGISVEGGETLAYEMISELRARGSSLDRLFIQVGGGALASACIHGFSEAVRAGVIERMPRIYGVQTRGAFPLQRAYEGITAWIAEAGGPPPSLLDANAHAELISAALQHGATHRADFMWPWEQTPHSIAHGILDDETYDWLAVVAGMLQSGGSPVVVSEQELQRANDLGRDATGIDVDPTGSAGLAGLLQLEGDGRLPAGEQIAVLFTGSLSENPR